MSDNPNFAVGDIVEKFTGDYQLPGEVRAVFITKRGKVRYVVEHDCGILHIYSEANLRPLQSRLIRMRSRLVDTFFAYAQERGRQR
jgi:hypothetical protein